MRLSGVSLEAFARETEGAVLTLEVKLDWVTSYFPTLGTDLSNLRKLTGS